MEVLDQSRSFSQSRGNTFFHIELQVKGKMFA